MEWKKEFLGPVLAWTSDPNIRVVEQIAVQSLQLSPAYHIDVSFLGGGSFSKVYKIITLGGTYVLRATLPVCPYWKTESEVSTLKFVIDRTTIPVPDVLAYDNSAQNGLGYEWTLMTFVPGKPLYQNWRQRPMESKESIVKQSAKGIGELLRSKNRFNRIGSMFHVKDEVGANSSDFRTYGVGNAIASHLWVRECADPSKTYGPLSDTRAWFQNITDTIIQTQQWLKQISDDEEDKAEAQDCINIAIEVQEVLREQLPANATLEQASIRHLDLRMANILVDEDSQLTGVIDWEFTLAEPLWSAIQPPKFLQQRESEGEPDRAAYADHEPPSVGEIHSGAYYDDHEGKSDAYWEHCMEWEMNQLRKVYDAEMMSNMSDYSLIKQEGVQNIDYSVAIGQLDRFYCHDYLWKWLKCVWYEKDVLYQDVKHAIVNGTFEYDERFKIEMEQDAEGVEDAQDRTDS